MGSKKIIEDLFAPEVQEELKKIKILLLDVDGVLTDSGTYWTSEHGWSRVFNIQDGFGIRLLIRGGMDVGIISAGDTEDLKERAKFLGIQHVYIGNEDKEKAFDKILDKTGFAPDQAAYMGDELFDIPILEKVGFSATVTHAVKAVRTRVNYVTRLPGGRGAVREVIEGIRYAQRIGPYF